MRDPNCVFCKIAAGEINPAGWVHRDEDFIAIVDIAPQAPKHLLVLPVDHVPNVSTYVANADPSKVAKLFSIAAQLGREQSAGGFRLVVNEGVDGGQTVDHLHVHVLAGRHMNWPPG